MARLLKLPQLLMMTLMALIVAACAEGNGNGDSWDLSLKPLFPEQVFSRPVALLQTPNPTPYWYVVEKGGRVLRVGAEEQSAGTAVFVDLTARVEAGPSEAGLLGMAFDPHFAENGQVYLSYTRGGPLTSVLSRFISSDGGLTLESGSEEVLLKVKQPYGNHNGGHIAFGPDGYLYYGLGDGGSAGDPEGNGQNTGTLLGSMLRIDVDSAVPYAIPPDNPFAEGGGRPEIYAYGLRNPWRWSFDRESGELWVGDVGQNAWEEIDRVSRGDNLGWNRWEGSHCYGPGGCDAEGVVMPVFDYSHTQGCSVTGGYVYRGRSLRALQGRYIFGDFCSGLIWELDSGNPAAPPRILLQSGRRISSFAEDREGELYVLDYASGRIFRFVATDVSE